MAQTKATVYYPQCFAFFKVVFDDQRNPGEIPEATVIPVRPRSCSVRLNSYKEADTFEMDFDAAAFPCTPEIIRTASAEIYIFQTDRVKDVDRAEIPRDLRGDLQPTIVGLVDSATYHAGADGRAFRVTGRDYTSLMLDKQWPQDKRIPVGEDLAKTVQDLVNEASKSNVLKVVTYTGAQESQKIDPRLSANEKALITSGKYRRTKKGELKVPKTGDGHTHTNKKGIPVHGGSSYWDVIYRLCSNHGLIAFVRGTNVVVSTPNVLTDLNKDKAAQMVFGKNLSYVDIERKLGKETVPQIEMNCYDPKSKKRIKVRYPSDEEIAKKQKTTAIGTKKDELRIIPVRHISDQGRLLEMAKLYYDNLARSEASIRFGTKDLKDLRGNDLLTLRPGDPVFVSFDIARLGDFKNKTVQEREAYLAQLRYDSRIARLVAANFDNLDEYQQPYYTKEVELQWSISSGIAIDVTGLNYINVSRDDEVSKDATAA